MNAIPSPSISEAGDETERRGEEEEGVGVDVGRRERKEVLLRVF